MPANGEWREIEELFFAAERLPPAERSALLDERCGDRHELRRQVERLLAAAETEHDRIAEVVGRAAADVDGAALVEEDDGRVGAYRLLEVIGQGGMGTVYLATRVDGEYRQDVAVKVVREGLARGDARRRFLRERQILARLDHPAVARLLDGGTLADGRPYLVMEHVEGLPIDLYCDRHRLPLRPRLALFLEVCEAVHDAHGHLVVHRDLKPSNILVGPSGHAKLLDFGISKLLGDDLAGGETTFGHRLLTPEFASPEQLRDEPVTTAVDVYALGLLLHRLLTGVGPYAGKPSTAAELRRTICEVEAERPSAAVRKLMASDPARAAEVASERGTMPARLVGLLTGDLDHIVAKALRKEPRERYRSVDRLAADLGRHLEGLPVEARRGDLRYRAGRFVRRHRTVVAAGLAALVALTLGLVGQIREAQRANREALASEQVVGFLTDLFDASDPMETLDTTTVGDLLHRAVARIDGELEDQPLVRARLMATLGRVYHNRGRFDEALPLFEQVLALRRAALPADHPDVATAHLDLADDLRVLGRVDEAMPHYERALELRRRRFGDDSLETAQVLNNLALNLIRKAELPRARELLERALAIRRRDLGPSYLVAQTLHNLTLIAAQEGDAGRARDLARETLAIKAEVLPADHPSTGRTLTLLADAEQDLGDYTDAEAALERALAIFRKAWGETHVDVLTAEGKLAEVHHLEGHVETAEAEQRRVLAAKREHLGAEHPEVARSLVALAGQLGDQGRVGEASPLLEEALAIRSKALGPQHPTTAWTRLLLADALCSARPDGRGLLLAEQGQSVLEAELPRRLPRIEQGRRILAHCAAGDGPGRGTPPTLPERKP
ncbi:MAG: serine/threonine protein kinase [Acidobacteria bacterium]|nr:serine/threonine protein kinase [Acidobacteriota bacterium]